MYRHYMYLFDMFFKINFIYQVYKRAAIMDQLELVTIPINNHMRMDSLQMEHISKLDMQKYVLMVPIEQFVIKISQQMWLVHCVVVE